MYQSMMDYVRHYLEKTNSRASELKKEFPFRNRFEHTLRVYEWARRINEAEKGDEEIVQIATIFHDAGKGVSGPKPHAETGAEICEAYLKQLDFPEDRIRRITEVIRKHSQKHLAADKLTLEERILMDADSLDEVGALCVLWDAIDHGSEPNPSYYAAYHRIRNSLSSLERDVGLLKTEEGNRLYQQRIRCLSAFLSELKYELGITD